MKRSVMSPRLCSELEKRDERPNPLTPTSTLKINFEIPASGNSSAG
ncbi:hypothetical protein LLG07_04185 [bacterium]|nr:hypothetical protein [bacterium]